jgi:outer membrane lipase/esterase
MLKQFLKLAGNARKTLGFAASAIAVCCAISTSAHAIPFNQISQIYFFGDSLTDSGFNDLWPGLQSGKAPTFTTYGGYVWAQYLARDIKGYVLPVYPGPNPPDTITNNTTPLNGAGFVSGTLRGIDYAAAGSTTNSIGNGETWAPSLKQQIAHYLTTAPQTLDPNAVYFVWSGANDLLKLLNSVPAPTELQLLIAANTAAVNIATEVALLSSRGAKRIVVVSLPNIGFTPIIVFESAANPGLPAMLKTVTFTFNSILNQQLGTVIKQYGTKVLYFDVYDLLDNVIAATKAGQPYVISGRSFKFVNYTQGACSPVNPSAVPAIECSSTAPNNWIFADAVHPSGMAHEILAIAVETAILNWK